MGDFHAALRDLQKAIGTCAKNNIDPYQQQKKSSLIDFHNQQEQAVRALFHGAIKTVQQEAQQQGFSISGLSLQKLCARLGGAKSIEECTRILQELSAHTAEQNNDQQGMPTIDKNLLPADIRDEVIADMKEIQNCYAAECYRSVVILCGRLLESALHRKYYEATGNDLLEKAPGIGLGNLVAKLAEKQVALDPGLSNQIHLVNQVRVFSVHKKNTPFHPSKEQAHAIFLYTIDVFNKLFRK